MTFIDLIKMIFTGIYKTLHLLFNLFITIGFMYHKSKLLHYVLHNVIIFLYLFCTFCVFILAAPIFSVISAKMKESLMINTVYTFVIFLCQIIGISLFYVFFDILEFNIITFDTGLMIIFVIVLICTLCYRISLCIKDIFKNIWKN